MGVEVGVDVGVEVKIWQADTPTRKLSRNMYPSPVEVVMNEEEPHVQGTIPGPLPFGIFIQSISIETGFEEEEEA